MNNIKRRESQFEILRIISMFLIVMYHFSIYTFGFETISFSYNKIVMDILSIGGKIGVNIFILISSYFMINKNFKARKFIKLFGQVWFYSIFTLIILKIFVPSYSINIKEIVKSVFPILLNKYWFVTAYILLMIFSPYLNFIINNFSEKMLKKLLVTLLFFSVIINGTISMSFEEMGCSIIWFSTLYLLIGYIKKYVDLTKKKKSKNLIIFIVSYALLALSCIIIDLVGYKMQNNNIILSQSRYFMRQNSILSFLASIELFLFFTKIKIKNNNIINKIASCSFGVYLIHDNDILRNYLWKTMFQSYNYYNYIWFILYALGVIIIVYSVCTLIELIRIETFEKFYLKIIDFFINKIKIILSKIKLSLNWKISK